MQSSGASVLLGHWWIAPRFRGFAHHCLAKRQLGCRAMTCAAAVLPAEDGWRFSAPPAIAALPARPKLVQKSCRPASRDCPRDPRASGETERAASPELPLQLCSGGRLESASVGGEPGASPWLALSLKTTTLRLCAVFVHTCVEAATGGRGRGGGRCARAWSRARGERGGFALIVSHPSLST